MIEPGDRVMVCLSGGKDSYTLLDLLLSLRRSAPVSFSIIAVNLDQKQPGFPPHVLPEYLTELGVDYHIIEQDTYAVVKRLIPEGKTMCSLCSRLRRGALYRYAAENGVSKIALGHHRDDLIETLFLNMFLAANRKPCLPSSNQRMGAISSSARWPMSVSVISSVTPPRAPFPSFPAPCAARRTTCSASPLKKCLPNGSNVFRPIGIHRQQPAQCDCLAPGGSRGIRFRRLDAWTMPAGAPLPISDV